MRKCLLYLGGSHGSPALVLAWQMRSAVTKKYLLHRGGSHGSPALFPFCLVSGVQTQMTKP
jgi:hypothetical protein